MAVVAGWILHLHLHKCTKVEQSHLNFRRDVTLSLLRMKPKIHSVPGPRAHSSKSLRQSDAHYLVQSTQGRCAVCQKNTTKKCLEYEKRLHDKYFSDYHGQ
ncbi:piggyBac transposable element-derived protein 2 [Trichonephila clavipes]|nr:piggyBac transposable element-derived protein 2 [Trichonephila clavipes]